MSELPTPDQVIAEAETWLRTPFHHQAMVKGAGVGCGTFLIGIYGAVGFRVPNFDDLGFFSKDWHLHEREERYLEILKLWMSEIETPERGCTALFKIGRVYSHAAIIVDWPHVIHTYWGRGTEYADATQHPLKRHPVLFLSPWAKQGGRTEGEEDTPAEAPEPAPGTEPPGAV